MKEISGRYWGMLIELAVCIAAGLGAAMVAVRCFF